MTRNYKIMFKPLWQEIKNMGKINNNNNLKEDNLLNLLLQAMISEKT